MRESIPQDEKEVKGEGTWGGARSPELTTSTETVRCPFLITEHSTLIFTRVPLFIETNFFSELYGHHNFHSQINTSLFSDFCVVLLRILRCYSFTCGTKFLQVF